MPQETYTDLEEKAAKGLTLEIPPTCSRLMQCKVITTVRTALGQLHALPHRNIAVCFTSNSGPQGVPSTATERG
jgi:hypothetical protein